MSQPEFTSYSKSAQKLNTQGCCFLCFKFRDFGENKINGDKVRHSFTIQSLLRHLQIKTESINGSTFGSFHGQAGNIEADLCGPCDNKIAKFSILLLQLEKVEMELKYLLAEIHQSISQSGKDTDLVQNYSKRMTSDPKALTQLVFVDNLRRELSKQSLNTHSNLRRPCVSLSRIKVPLKQVIKEEAKEREKSFCESFDYKIEEPETNNQLFNDCLAQSEPANSPGSSSPLEEYKLTQTVSSQESFGQDSTSTTNRKRSNRYRQNPLTGLFQCTKCDQTFKYSRNIGRHYRIVHLKERYILSSERHKCDLCNIASFKRLDSLRIHKKSCQQNLAKQKDPNYKFACCFCTKRFETKRKLTRHRIAVHKNFNRYACDLCEKKFTSLDTLKIHKDVIHLGKTFSCEFCNKEYRAPKTLRIHKIVCVQRKEIKTESIQEMAE